MKLFLNALTKFLLALVFVVVLLFVPAGGFDYINGWIFVFTLFVPVMIMGGVLLFKAPGLLEKRLNLREKEKTQKGVVAFSALFFLAGFIIAGLDHRFGWSSVPLPVVIVSAVVLLVGYGLYAEVMRENAYLSRTVEVQKGQRVIDSGLYGIVRHPMYGATLLIFLAIPLILGSWWAVFCFLLYIPVLVVRILNEEKVLSAELEGYTEYKARVKFRLFPFVW